MTNITNTMNSYSSLSPFARMLAQVISEAVVASFRSGQIQFNASAFQGSDRQDDNRNIRQQLTMHLSPELFQQMEPESDENSFMRFMRLPVIISSIVSSNQSEGATPGDQSTDERANSNSQSTTSSTAATNNNNPSTTTTTTTSAENSSNNQSSSPSSSTGLFNNDEVTRILMLPVFLYGIRSNHQLNLSSVLHDDDSSTSEQPVRRQSQRLRERQQREEDNNNAEEETRNSNNNNNNDNDNNNNNTSNGSGNNGQWTVYIISGNSVENIMSERNPTYEELLDLASIIGPARRPTVSQEAIDSHVPIVKYTQQVKQNIIGNSEGCQVCLNAYQSEEDVRILACHHGFHKECIDKWLTEGQNQCPLCRNVPVPTNSSS
ncbi:hypothetical protein BCV71DRAFT_244570 [Rhizopus microsporus]|nr:hypothetical protein BCV71DRAFT_244570 [Rhizopus microsporus]